MFIKNTYIKEIHIIENVLQYYTTILIYIITLFLQYYGRSNTHADGVSTGHIEGYVRRWSEIV